MSQVHNCSQKDSANQVWVDPNWKLLRNCTPGDWEYYIRGGMRNHWTELDLYARELIYKNAVMLSHQQLKED